MEKLLASHLQARLVTMYYARLPITLAGLALDEEMQAAERFSLHPCNLRRCTQQTQVTNDSCCAVLCALYHIQMTLNFGRSRLAFVQEEW
jgi:hypothetical protein